MFYLFFFSSLFMGTTLSYFCIRSPPKKRLIKKTNFKNKSKKQKQQLKNYYLFHDTPLINI